MLLPGCIENLAPEGLEDLREAKVDLLKAQTALQTAQAAKLEAEAALLMSEAKINEALAKQAEAKVKYEEAMALKAEYEAEYQKLLNEAFAQEQADEHARRVAELEALMAENEARLADIEREAQLAAAALQAELLEIQTRLVNAEAAYDQALKDLKASKVTLSPKQKSYLSSYEFDVTMAQGKVLDYTKELENAAEALEEAIAEVDKNKADKRAIYGAEKSVKVAMAALEGAKEALALAEAALEVDPMVAGWSEQLLALVSEAEALAREQFEGALDHMEESQALQDSLAILTEAYQQYENLTGYSFNDLTGKFSYLPVYGKQTQYGPELYVKSPKDEEGNDLFSGDLYNYSPAFEYGNADAYGVLSTFDHEIELYKNFSDPSWPEAYIKAYKTVIERIATTREDEYAAYDEAVAAYKSGDVTAYYQKMYDNEEWDPAARVAEYNEALAAFIGAVDAYIVELKKYESYDLDEERKQLLATRKAAISAALAARAKAYQDAYDVYRKASRTYDKAWTAYDRAGQTYNSVMDAAVETVRNIDTYPIYTYSWSIASDLTTAIANYEAAKKEEGFSDPDGKYAAAAAIYDTELKKVKAAQKAYNDLDDITNREDAQSVYDAAYEAWTAAENAWYKAENEIITAYNKAYDAAWSTYRIALQDLNQNDNPLAMHYENERYLSEVVENAYVALFGGETRLDGIWQGDYSEGALSKLLNQTVRPGYSYTSVTVGDYEYYYRDIYLPEFAVVENDLTPRSLKLEDVVDLDYFLENEVKYRADALSATHHIDAYWQVQFPEYDYGNSLTVVLGAPEDYPLSLPTYDSYVAAMADFESEAEFVENYMQKFNLECVAASGYSYYYGYNSYTGTPYREMIDYKDLIAGCEKQIANSSLAAEHVAVLEAAKAEFEAYVAAADAEVDALRPVVEEKWPLYMEQYQALEESVEAAEAQFSKIFRTVENIQLLLEICTGFNDPEQYVEYLELVYNDAVDAVAYAEFDLEDAQANLETVKNGGEDAITAVEMAQKYYDKVAVRLDEALAELEAAADALENAMVAVGAAEPEETPEDTPETPEDTPETPEDTPETPEDTPETPEDTPETPEDTPETPEDTPETPEETPEDTPETPAE